MPESKVVRGFLFAHYDSRGGTSFVTADTKEQALEKYVRYWWGRDISEEQFQKDMIDMSLPELAEDDCVGEARLHVHQDFNPDWAHGKDLEGNEDLGALKDLTGQVYWEALEKIPALGMVLAPGSRTNLRDIDPDTGMSEDGDFFEFNPEEIVDLEFVPQQSEPIFLKKFCHPRWDDDAYSFIFVK